MPVLARVIPAPEKPARSVCPATVRLPYEPQSAGAGRRFVRAKLREWGLDRLVDDAELIVSELIANAVDTGCRTHMIVKIRRVTEVAVRISVRDGSRSLPVLIDAGGQAESGRGMALVHRLTEGHWGVRADPHGKTVHADLPAPLQTPHGAAPAP